MATAAILAIDLGTQSLRVTALSAAGGALWSWSRPVRSIIDGDRDEQDPAEWQHGLSDGLAAAAAAGLRPVAVAAAGPLAGYVALDADGTPLTQAAMYFDRRARRDVIRVERELAATPHALRPTVADPLPQLLRLKREAPATCARMAHFLDATGVLNHLLTGQATLNAYTALRLYDPTFAARLGLDRSRFGTPTSIGRMIAPLRPELADAFGWGEVPIVSATFDSKCAYIAGGLAEAGDGLDISGTVTSFGVLARAPIVDAQRRIYAVPLDGRHLVRGSMAGAGSILEWVCREILGHDVTGLDHLAAAAPAGARGAVMIPYHSGARAPLWEPDARGGFVGLALDCDRACLARAAYEGLAFGLRHIADIMAACGAPLRRLRLAGGLSKSATLAQIKADVLGVAVTRLADHELSTLGLGVIASVALGLYPDHASASASFVRTADRFDPGPAAALYRDAYGRYLAYVEALRPSFTAAATPEHERRSA